MSAHSQDVGIFSYLEETICLLDDKRLNPRWGAQATENPLGVAGEMSGCHAA